MMNELLPIKNIFKNKDVVSIDQFDRRSVDRLFKTTSEIIKLNPRKKLEILKGRVITLLFFEPSSRTFGSFSSAIKRLGGITIDYQNPNQTSSAVKGETLSDTIKVFENYSDAIVMRHYEMGAAKRAADAALFIPVINAGDGSGEHPTQALLDGFTLKQEFGKLDELKGVLAGDLLYGRTVHSLIRLFNLFNNVTLYLLSPKNLRLPEELMKRFAKSNVKLVEIPTEKDIPKDCHFWYWTRVQKERFKDLKEYEKVKTRFILTPELVKERGNKNMLLMHPLPRVGEIDERVDSDPRAIYLSKQVKNGMYVRMGLLQLILGK